MTMETEKPTVLVIDDDFPLRQMLRLALENYGFTVHEAASGDTGVTQVATHNPDVILLDLALPDGSGLVQLEKIRSWSNVPIIILSANSLLQTKIDALESGANDFITKPYSSSELAARIRVQLRRKATPRSLEVLEFGPNQVDFSSLVVTRYGKEVNLSAKELSLLLLLTRSPERVITYRMILRGIWGDAGEGHIQYLYVYIRRLRMKLEVEPSRPHFILTEPGIGLRLSLTGSLAAARQAKQIPRSA